MANLHSGAMASLEAMIAGVGAQYYDKQIPKDITREGLTVQKRGRAIDAYTLLPRSNDLL